jgi:hypothetical protein
VSADAEDCTQTHQAAAAPASATSVHLLAVFHCTAHVTYAIHPGAVRDCPTNTSLHSNKNFEDTSCVLVVGGCDSRHWPSRFQAIVVPGRLYLCSVHENAMLCHAARGLLPAIRLPQGLICYQPDQQMIRLGGCNPCCCARSCVCEGFAAGQRLGASWVPVGCQSRVHIGWWRGIERIVGSLQLAVCHPVHPWTSCSTVMLLHVNCSVFVVAPRWTAYRFYMAQHWSICCNRLRRVGSSSCCDGTLLRF